MGILNIPFILVKCLQFLCNGIEREKRGVYLEINIENIVYEVEMISEDGSVFSLTSALISLQWEEQQNELAQRVTMTTGNIAIGNTWLMAVVKIACPLFVYANWGEGRVLVFSGQIWQWDYQSGQKKILTIKAYDNMKYLQQSYDYAYYSGGQTTKTLLETICREWGIPLSYQWGQMLNHEKKVFQNKAISEMILELLEDVKKNSGESYVCHWKEGELLVARFGCNSSVYLFSEENTMSTSHSISMDQLVTKVKIMGNVDDDGRSFVEAVVEGNQEFGLLQKIIVRDNNTTLGEVTAEARAYLQQYDTPEELVSVVVPDVPFTRKGDRISMNAGNLIGDFYVLGVCHDAVLRKMSLNLLRCE